MGRNTRNAKQRKSRNAGKAEKRRNPEIQDQPFKNEEKGNKKTDEGLEDNCCHITMKRKPKAAIDEFSKIFEDYKRVVSYHSVVKMIDYVKLFLKCISIFIILLSCYNEVLNKSTLLSELYIMFLFFCVSTSVPILFAHRRNKGCFEKTISDFKSKYELLLATEKYSLKFVKFPYTEDLFYHSKQFSMCPFMFYLITDIIVLILSVISLTLIVRSNTDYIDLEKALLFVIAAGIWMAECILLIYTWSRKEVEEKSLSEKLCNIGFKNGKEAKRIEKRKIKALEEKIKEEVATNGICIEKGIENKHELEKTKEEKKEESEKNEEEIPENPGKKELEKVEKLGNRKEEMPEESVKNEEEIPENPEKKEPEKVEQLENRKGEMTEESVEDEEEILENPEKKEPEMVEQLENRKEEMTEESMKDEEEILEISEKKEPEMAEQLENTKEEMTEESVQDEEEILKNPEKKEPEIVEQLENRKEEMAEESVKNEEEILDAKKEFRTEEGAKKTDELPVSSESDKKLQEKMPKIESLSDMDQITHQSNGIRNSGQSQHFSETNSVTEEQLSYPKSSCVRSSCNANIMQIKHRDFFYSCQDTGGPISLHYEAVTEFRQTDGKTLKHDMKLELKRTCKQL